MDAPTSDPKTKALEFFKDWTNYLLVTTVAALGWVATSQSLDFSSNRARFICIVSFAASIVFGIFTLALIPIIQEERGANQSNYDVAATHSLFGHRRCRLVAVCYPQHAFFLLGIVTFAVATAWSPTKGAARTLDYILIAAAVAVAISIWVIWGRSGKPWQAADAASITNAGPSPPPASESVKKADVI